MAHIVKITLPTGKTYSQPTGLFIDNEFVKATSGRTFETINPATGKVICSVQEADENDVDIAVKAARKAFHRNSTWRQMPPTKRGRLLCKLADLMEENAELLASVETLDNGKALKMATADVQGCADVFRYYGGWADKIVGQTVDTGGDRLGYTLHEPIGVCGQIIPWNFPLLMLTVDKVAFTGSTAVGRSILHAAASSNLKKVTLELGGKSPQIIFNDADLSDAVKWTVEGSFFNHGQNCAAGSRIYVQSGVYNEFVSLFKDEMKKIIIGDPFDSNTYQGPQISQAQFDRIMGYIQSARDEGGNIEVGGQKIGNEGYFIHPTVITNVNKNMKVVQEEIFGPVVVISKFDTAEEVIDLGNATQFGLAAGVHSKDFKQSIQVAKGLEAGSIYVNCYNRVNHQMPFGGYKLSGIGRELGSYALENYCEVKSIHVNMGMPAPVFKL